MIKVYFGPYKHSPAKPIAGGEAELSIADFHLLRGYDRDFWTNNPFVLDCFKPEQIWVWTGDWTPLLDAVEQISPDSERSRLARLKPGKMALSVEVIRLVGEHCTEQDAKGADPAQVIAEIKAMLLH